MNSNRTPRSTSAPGLRNILWATAVLALLCFTSGAPAHAQLTVSFTGNSGTIDYSTNSGSSSLNNNINTDAGGAFGTGIGYPLSTSISSIQVNGTPIPVPGTVSLGLNSTGTDMGYATLLGGTGGPGTSVLQFLYGAGGVYSGNFSISEVGSGTLASATLTPYYISGTVGGTTAEMVWQMTNLSSTIDPAISNLGLEYLDITGTIANGGTFQLQQCPTTAGPNCPSGVGGIDYVPSFDLDFSATVSSTPPASAPGMGGSPSSTPEPSSLLLLGSGLLGSAFSFRRIRGLRNRAN
jgi:hypothetical protein